MKSSRIEKFRKLVKKQGLNGFIVSNPTNIFYLTGFKGVLPTDREAYLVVFQIATLVTARIYQTEAKRVRSKNLAVKIAQERNEMIPLVAKLLNQTHSGSVSIGFEENDLKYGEYQKLKRKFSTRSNSNPKLIPYESLIEQIRQIKTADEIAKIEKAQLISQLAFDQIIKTIKVGQTEQEIAQTLQQIIRSLGGLGLAFESIIASGPNSGIPHHRTGSRRLATRDILLFDFGAKYQDYCADLSRTIFIGKTKDGQKNIYQHVKHAQEEAILKISHGIKSQDVFHAANKHFKKHKLEKYFLHGLGHGVGLEIHELPYLRPYSELRFRTGFGIALRARIDQQLTENMVFSIEPGLYFPWGGVRIEDLVVIKNGKVKVLGKVQEQIIEIH